MSDYNVQNNRAVWFDVPVADLDRATEFYSSVLGIEVFHQEFEGTSFGVLEHKDGNGGCLVVKPDEVTGEGGILVYFNVNERIRDAVEKVGAHGGEVVTPVHAIGPHGFCAIVLDSEGNRIALHSNTDE